MTKSILVLDQEAYRTSIGSVDPGNLAKTHIALIKHPNNESAKRFYVKFFIPNPSNKIDGFINEIVGYLFLKAAKFKVPDNACIIDVPVTELTALFPELKFKGNEDVWPCWAVQEISGKTPNQYINNIALNSHIFTQDFLKFSRCHDIVSADDTIANVDRNTGNLIKCGNNKWAFIDNGELVNVGGWLESDLDINRLYRNTLSYNLWRDNPAKEDANKVIHSAASHVDYLNETLNEIKNWANLLLNSSTERSFLNFIQTRSDDAPDRLKKRYNILI